MPAPVLKSEFKDIIPSSGAGICEKMVKVFIRLPVLLYKLIDWLFNDDGTFSDAAKTELGGAVTGGTGDGTTVISAPTNVAASDGNGTFEDKVRLTWSPVAGAVYYEVHRGTSTDSALSEQKASPNLTTYDDSQITVGQVYYYFVKAVSSTGIKSVFSTGDSGIASVALTALTYGAGYHDLIVPAGWATIDIVAYGDGGGGGGQGIATGTIAGAQFYGGAGGGSGEKRTLLATAVVTNDTFQIQVGGGGALGVGGPNATNGADGTLASVSKNGSLTPTVIARGGKGGQRGYNSTFGVPQGGIGGTNGTGGAGVNGDDGDIGPGPGTSPSGGAGGTATDGFGKGGNGGSYNQNGVVGNSGWVIITPHA